VSQSSQFLAEQSISARSSDRSSFKMVGKQILLTLLMLVHCSKLGKYQKQNDLNGSNCDHRHANQIVGKEYFAIGIMIFLVL